MCVYVCSSRNRKKTDAARHTERDRDGDGEKNNVLLLHIEHIMVYKIYTLAYRHRHEVDC